MNLVELFTQNLSPRQKQYEAIRAVAFNKANFYAKLVQNADSFSLAFTPRINSYYGNPIVELVVKDIHFP